MSILSRQLLQHQFILQLNYKTGKIEMPGFSINKDKVVAFIKLARLKFLLYSLLSYSLGSLLCLHSGVKNIRLDYYFLGLLSVWIIHVMTHFCNEYYDFEADKANHSFTNSTGGSRVLVDGHLKPKNSITAAFITLFCSLFLLAQLPNKACTVIMTVALFLGWFYTAPPLALNYNRLGEFTVTVTLSLLVPLMGYCMQAGKFSFEIIPVLVPTSFFQYTRMMLMNLADHDGDIQVKKHTMAVALGKKNTVIVYSVGQLLAYVMLILFYILDVIPLAVVIMIFATLPIGVWQFKRLLNDGFTKKQSANRLTFWASTQSAMVILALYCGILADIIVNKGLESVLDPHNLYIITVPFLMVFVLILLQIIAMQRIE